MISGVERYFNEANDLRIATKPFSVGVEYGIGLGGPQENPI